MIFCSDFSVFKIIFNVINLKKIALIQMITPNIMVLRILLSCMFGGPSLCQACSGARKC